MRYRTLLVAATTACGTGPATSAPMLTPACCAVFDYVLEATIFQIDAVRLELRVDDRTAADVRALVRAAQRSAALDSAIAHRYLNARETIVSMTFLVSMTATRFLSQTESVLRRLGDEGLLAADDVERLAREARFRFAFLRDGGVHDGDRMEYQVLGDSVTTSYVRPDGSRALHDVQVGRAHRVAVLGSYFARSSEFRTGLLDQVFAPRSAR